MSQDQPSNNYTVRDSLHKAIADGSAFRDYHKFFCGPNAPFQKHVDNDMLRNLPPCNQRGVEKRQWDTLVQLATVAKSSSYDVGACLAALQALDANVSHACEPSGDERSRIQAVLDKYPELEQRSWSLAHWLFIDNFAEACGCQLPIIREKTPILLANQTFGTVLYLVAEKVPGPPGLLCPMWWKLGLLPILGQNGLLNSVHKGFRTVIDELYPNERFRIRWWLELGSHVEKWPKDLDECPSLEVAAACLAEALYQPHLQPDEPLLDTNVAFSGQLGVKLHWGTGLSRYPIVSVGHAEKKKEAAVAAGLNAILFAEEMRTKFEHLQGETGIRVQFVANLADAYDSLLVTSSLEKEYREKVGHEWTKEWGQMQPTPSVYKKK